MTERITVRDVEARVAAIAAEQEAPYGWDHEAAHVKDDALRDDLLKAIADGAVDDPAACARAALRTNVLDFERWYA